MADVVQIVEGDYVPVECLEDGASNTPGDACAMREVWREVRESVNTILSRTTLQSLAERRKRAIHFQI